MACACKKSTKKVKTVSDKKVNDMNMNLMQNNTRQIQSVQVHNMARMVNFEGQSVLHGSIPEGSLFIKGVWYSSPESMPEDVRKEYRALYEGWSQRYPTKTSAEKSSNIK